MQEQENSKAEGRLKKVWPFFIVLVSCIYIPTKKGGYKGEWRSGDWEFIWALGYSESVDLTRLGLQLAAVTLVAGVLAYLSGAWDGFKR